MKVTIQPKAPSYTTEIPQLCPFHYSAAKGRERAEPVKADPKPGVTLGRLGITYSSDSFEKPAGVTRSAR